MFYCVKYFSISIMRFKITSALVLHRFMKISLRRMFSRSVSGRPLRKPNNFCISPPGIRKAVQSLHFFVSQALFGIFALQPLACVCTCGQSTKSCIFRYLFMKLWGKPYYQAACVFRCLLFYIFLIHTKYASIKVCNPMRACERSRSPLAYGQTKCVCMTLVFLA